MGGAYYVCLQQRILEETGWQHRDLVSEVVENGAVVLRRVTLVVDQGKLQAAGEPRESE